ncbi:uncharacterized protein LOC124133578 [Haliotis rufescens]|uniref:uncharacterized protein LOC124133578 n=1 Tax=Haliotis rufescens TaxID=6454 RepID=UPI001EAFAD6D|nr:uncharacterized protein LOC124133578 [Haliotis rufescens]XP_046353975.1 uncharacterized protein LOC124133578 [Haliotis rufescens]
MKIALVLLFLTAMVALPGTDSWGIRLPRFRSIVRTVGGAVRRVASKVVSTVKKVGDAIKSGKRDVSEFDVDGDGQVSDDEIMMVLATRDVDDLVQDGYVTESDKEDISLYQRHVREDADLEME